MDRLELGNLTIVVDDSEKGVIRVKWEGMSSALDPGQALRPYFAIVASRATEEGATVEHHFEDLRFLNSSTIAVLLQLIREGQERKFHQRVYFDASLRWQAVSFQALRVFSGPESRFELVPLRADRAPIERSGA